MSTIPPYLKLGDTIGICCPAGAVSMQDMQPMLRQLKAWGFNIVLGKTVGSQYGKFSAPDEVRLKDFQVLLNDDSIDAILFGRGGYGLVRIIDKIDFSKFVKQPKWLLGYSDITCLHSHIHSQFGIHTIHGHMCGGYKQELYDEFSTNSILSVLYGNPMNYSCSPHSLNRNGSVKACLIGGNLSLISDLIGTKSDLDTSGKILFLEDIAEYKYNLDRMLWQLLRAGKFDSLAGLIVGGFAETKDNETPFGMTEYEIVWEKVKHFNYPVCFNFPVGHQPRNVALKCGTYINLEVTEKSTRLLELFLT